MRPRRWVMAAAAALVLGTGGAVAQHAPGPGTMVHVARQAVLDHLRGLDERFGEYPDGLLCRYVADREPRLAGVMLEPVAEQDAQALLRGPAPDLSGLNRAELEAVCKVLIQRVGELEGSSPTASSLQRELTDLRVSEARQRAAVAALRAEHERLRGRYRGLQRDLRFWQQLAAAQPPVVPAPPPRSTERIDPHLIQRHREAQSQIRHEQMMHQLGEIQETLED